MLRSLRKSARRALGWSAWRPRASSSPTAYRRPAQSGIEAMEARWVLSIAPVVVGSVYVEEDLGSDLHGDTFYLTFQGGAPGTQLTYVEINGDQNDAGFNVGDVFFDTNSVNAATGPGRFGADSAFPFQLVSHDGIDRVTAYVEDGTSLLRLEFEGFDPGERLVFSIDVDEVEEFDPQETDVERINEGFDPLTSGVEFQGSKLTAHFTAPHFEDSLIETEFRNVYDRLLEGTNLDLPPDDEGGKRDRTAAGVGQDVQTVIPASLSGHVYHDANQNGRFDAGEVGLAGVTVRARPLETVVDQAVESVTTDEHGYYRFERLMPGRYAIVEPDQPAGYFDWLDAAGTVDGQPNGIAVNPGDMIDQVTLAGGSVGIDYDFGEILPVSLAGTVHLSTADGDCFGEDVEHAPLAGVEIRLLDADGNEVARTTTNADGHYLFANLMPGTYTVIETTPVGLFDGGAQAGSIDGARDTGAIVLDANTIQQIELLSGQNGTNYDFCEHAPSELSGFVYHDRNDNGRRDANEEGIARVVVQLVDPSDHVVAEAVTDADGAYVFRELTAGNYRIVEQHPSGWLDGQDAAGTIDGQVVGRAVNPGDRIDDVFLGWGQRGHDYNFGELRPTAIYGRVHLSTVDGDCWSEEFDHEPLEGVVVQLLDADGGVIDETRTDAAGNYAFVDLPPGIYGVHEITPEHLIDGGANAGQIDGRIVGLLVDSNTILQLDLRSGDALRDVDFCEHEPATLAGFVYHDRDDDAVRDEGEEPIPGTTVILLDAAGQEVQRTETDASGAYRFAQLHRGQYSVVELQPDGWDDGQDTAGTVDGLPVGVAINPGDEIRQIDLGWGQAGVDYNFGELRLGSLAGRVHADLNADCEFQEGEWALAGVVIELLDAQGRVVSTTQTDDAGEFRFDGLRPGEYTLREIQPEGYFSSGQTAGTGGGDASVDNLISRITVASGDDLVDYHFCEEPPSSISGYVFQDGPAISLAFNEPMPDDLSQLRDGQMTSDDRPLAGVTLQLHHGVFGTPIDASTALPGYYGPGVITTVTDENGFYTFTGLRKGNYSVYEIQPAGFLDGIDTSGTVPAIAINRHTFGEIEPQVLASLERDPNFDAIVRIALFPNVHSERNNFSEVVVERAVVPVLDVPPPAPVPPATSILIPPLTFVDVDVPPLPYQQTPFGRMRGVTGSTWHLSLLDGGTPRGNGETVPNRGPVWFARTSRYRVAWDDAAANDLLWVITVPGHPDIERRFGVAEGIPFAGDFNGDGISELGVFFEGQWFIDLNANGRWDDGDVWAHLGHFGDQPVVGDWNGDGKDDIGVFGIAWAGDPHAVEREPGLPDRENLVSSAPKNQPPRVEDATRATRSIRLRASQHTRDDLIDHVFHFGVTGHQAVSGDWNGDGIANVGVFDKGTWHLDRNGDGLFGDEDIEAVFGAEGDIPIAGDFNGDGIDEIGILSQGRLVLDINRNYRIDPGDAVIPIDRQPGRPVVGDWNGDGIDEVAMVYADKRIVEAARNRDLK